MALDIVEAAACLRQPCLLIADGTRRGAGCREDAVDGTARHDLMRAVGSSILNGSIIDRTGTVLRLPRLLL